MTRCALYPGYSASTGLHPLAMVKANNAIVAASSNIALTVSEVWMPIRLPTIPTVMPLNARMPSEDMP